MIMALNQFFTYLLTTNQHNKYS